MAGPQPEVHASPALRALVWAMDLAPFLLVSFVLRERMPWVGPTLFVLAGLIGMLRFGSTPGIWLMRLRLRTTTDADVTVARGFARFLVQHGWYLPASIGLAALFASSDAYLLLVPAAIWCALSLLGSLPVFTKNGQTLHDLITKTRVLVDLRYRT